MTDTIIDKKMLEVERPDIMEEANIKTDEDMELYLKLYNAYNKLVLAYFIKNFHLKELDDTLAQHQDVYVMVNSDDKDLYQKSAEGFLNYLYIRNDLHIERLTSEEKEYLLNIIDSQNVELTEQNEQFIDKTYYKILIDNIDKPGKNIYGPSNSKFINDNDVIIIGIRYDEFANFTEQDPDVYRKVTKAKWELEVLTDFINQKLKKEQKRKLTFIQYDQNSIKKNSSYSVNR